VLKRLAYKIGRRLLKSHPPRWIIFLIDLSIWILSILLAFYVRLNFNLEILTTYPFHIIIPAVILARSTVYISFRLYSGLIRYSSVTDLERIITVNLLGSFALVIVNIVFNRFNIEDINLIPYGALVIEFLISTLTMISLRLMIKTLYNEIRTDKRDLTSVVIFGVGELANLTRQAVENNKEMAARVIGFISPADERDNCVGNKLAGIRIYSENDLEDLAGEANVGKLIIAREKTGISAKERLIEKCSGLHIKILMVSMAENWVEGNNIASRIRELNIEDLLERPSIKLDIDSISKEFSGKVILVTGAAGSIGSELVRQLRGFNPLKLILYDQAETPLHSLSLELRNNPSSCDFEITLGDITNQNRLEYIFSKHKPEIVFHAAAYKHVPMLEDNPKEAMRTNVYGTRIVADLSVKFGVSKFIMISTDKAVNPTNIMGASKRISEMYIQSLDAVEGHNTHFITTRFGNVLGSNGSVVELFKEQIGKGENITVTHPDVARYFMIIPEAVQLVLEAGTMGQGGEIFVFDMGQMVKIRDLANKMIRLSGLIPDKDIKIDYVGLRPGERLYEELLAEKENLLPTHHPKILIARIGAVDNRSIARKLDKLYSIFHKLDKTEVVRFMKEMVPEYRSQNSVYSALD